MTRLSLAVALVLALVLPAVAADHPLLVTPAWVAERLGRADVRIIDLSDAEDYARGHIPGAVHLDFTDTRPQASEGVFRAPTAEEGRRLFARLGITPDTTVILYDDEGGLHAAWLFLVLDVLGHPRVSVLDGGSQRWRAGGGAWTTDVPRAPASSRVPAPRVSADRLAGAAWVRERLGRRDVALVDARTPDEFDGRDVRARRGGHIPRALSGPLSPEAGVVYYTSVIWVRQLPSALRSNSRPGSPPPRSAPVCLRVASFVISWRRPRPPGAGGPSCDWRDRSAARAISRHGRAFRTREGHRRHGLSRGIREP